MPYTTAERKYKEWMVVEAEVLLNPKLQLLITQIVTQYNVESYSLMI